MPSSPPIVDSLPTPPNPSDRATFNARAYPWSLALGDMTTDMNTLATWTNNTATEVSVTATEVSVNASNAAAAATQAQNAADAVLNTPGTLVQFTQSHTIGTGLKEFDVGNAPYAAGQFVIVAKTSAPSNYMAGQVMGFSMTGMSVNILYTEGSGTHSDWTLSLSPAAIAGFIKNTPSGSVSATTVQNAINELDTEKVGKTGNHTMAGVLTAGGLLSNAGPIGYGVGSGGTVTQATSKSTAVTLNKPCGTITMHNQSLAAGATVIFAMYNAFAVTGTTAAATLRPVIGTDIASYHMRVVGVGLDGASDPIIFFSVANISAGALAETVIIDFAIIRVSTS